jgi:hypothetical protein
VKVRVVRDGYLGYEAQGKVWWWPFWFQLYEKGHVSNTHSTLDAAKEFALRKKAEKKVVWREPIDIFDNQE